jgi:glycosyltransferase involved in cell wall biosynthesis
VHQYLDGLSRDGFDTEVFLAGGLNPRRRLELLRRARAADVIFIQKKLFHPIFLPLIGMANSNIVFDYDDAAFAVEPWENRPRGMAPGSASSVRRLKAILKRARTVVAGNEYLASYARKYNRNVRVLPTPVNTGGTAETGSRDKRDGGLRVGWLGTSKNLYYLKHVQAGIDEALNKFPGAKLSVLSNAEIELGATPVENVRWSPENEAGWLGSIDVGVMPLEDDGWSRGKCAFKLLQYMAAGLPTVSSPVGMNAEVIEDGVNGMLAKTDTEWSYKIAALLGNGRLREEIGERARRTVEKKYSLDVCTRELTDILRATLR